MNEDKQNKITLIFNIIVIIAIILILYSFIMILSINGNSDNMECYWTTRGYICVFGSDEE